MSPAVIRWTKPAHMPFNIGGISPSRAAGGLLHQCNGIAILPPDPQLRLDRNSPQEDVPQACQAQLGTIVPSITRFNRKFMGY